MGVFTRAALTLLMVAALQASPAAAEDFDVAVYGGTSAGVTAAVQAAKMGKRVVLIEPGRHVGGMTSGGLGFVDVGRVPAVGGLTREFFHRVWEHYQDDSAWTHGTRHPIAGQHAALPKDAETQWIVEPSVAELLFEGMLAEAHVPVVREARLNRGSGVVKSGTAIVSIASESGQVWRAKMFIDATYEGDLMAAAGVSYALGREPNSEYGERFNGIRPSQPIEPALGGIDPYVVQGEPNSGLLPRIRERTDGPIVGGDKWVQAYNYRLCLTDVPENRVAISKPAGYDEKQYEIVLRAVEAGVEEKDFLKLSRIQNGKTDTNNGAFISTDYVGMSSDYPEADYATRERIAREHEQWIRGLIWTLQNHPRVPEPMRAFFLRWGLARDEFTGNGNWPFQLYVREARRMIGEAVVTEEAVLRRGDVPDPVGLASYRIDSHAMYYVVGPSGKMMSQGGMGAAPPSPYGITYRALVPKSGECANLLVPVCLSASHSAYGSIRMEPVFMILGQSAATAACQALDAGCDVQALAYAPLRERLLRDRQILAWPVPPSSPAPAQDAQKQ